MSRSILFSFAIAMSVFALIAPADAQQRTLTDEQKAALHERLKAADTNGDGLIDKSEADAGLPRIARRFDTLDANGDGKLSSDELRAVGQKMAGRRRR